MPADANMTSRKTSLKRKTMILSQSQIDENWKQFLLAFTYVTCRDHGKIFELYKPHKSKELTAKAVEVMHLCSRMEKRFSPQEYRSLYCMYQKCTRDDSEYISLSFSKVLDTFYPIHVAYDPGFLRPIRVLAALIAFQAAISRAVDLHNYVLCTDLINQMLQRATRDIAHPFTQGFPETLLEVYKTPDPLLNFKFKLPFPFLVTGLLIFSLTYYLWRKRLNYFS
jgi:hypothetical protein